MTRAVLAAGGRGFHPSMLGTVPRWDTAFYAVSGSNIGISGASAWTIQALVSTDTIDQTSGFRWCVQIGATSALNGAAIGPMNLDTSGFRWAISDVSVNAQSRITPIVLQWYLLTGTYDGTTLKLYVDGSLVVSRAVTLNVTNGTLIINGRRAHNAWFHDGGMCRIGQWARALTADEVARCAADPRVSETLGPVRFYRCDEGSGTTLVDRGSAGDNATITGTPVWVAATSLGPTWHRIIEFMPIGHSMVAGTATQGGSWRKTEWPNFARKVNSIGERTAVPGTNHSYYNAALSGDTIATAGTRLNGTWGNSTDFAIGSPGDPGAGNRGEMEDTVAREVGQGGGGPAGIVMTCRLMTNDAALGVVDVPSYEVFLRRAVSIARVAAIVRKLIVCTETPRTDNGTFNGRITTANAALPAMVANLVAAGIPAELADVAAVINTGTMLEADGLHLNAVGYPAEGGVIRPLIEAA